MEFAILESGRVRACPESPGGRQHVARGVSPWIEHPSTLSRVWSRDPVQGLTPLATCYRTHSGAKTGFRIAS